MLLDSKTGETEAEFWQRQNKHDEKQLIEKGYRKEELKLYCQSCCYRYPDECIDMDTMHPYDRAAETCPDFIPKDYYKPLSKAKCWKKRLSVDPDWITLPDCDLRHPIQWYAFVPSSAYYKVMTKMKVYNYLDYLKKIEVD